MAGLGAFPSLPDLADRLLLELDSVTQLSGVQDILRSLLKDVRAYGVVVWEVAPGLAPVEGRRLFAQGQYFHDNRPPPAFDVAMDTISGRAIINGTSAHHWLQDGKWNAPVKRPDLLQKLRITGLATVPMRLRSPKGPKFDSALTFYSRLGRFGQSKLLQFERVAAIFPTLYRCILEKVSLGLQHKVQEVLRHADFPKASSLSYSNEQARKVLRTVAQIIEQTFGNHETVIYLLPPMAQEERFDLYAKQWPWIPDVKDSYTPGDGGTGWVLKTGKPLQILDMRLYESDRKYYEKQYPGMIWSDRIGIANQLRHLQKLSLDSLPPLSYVCVPVMHEHRVLGAMRCCIPAKGPYYFDDDLTKALSAVADLLGDWWAHWRDEVEHADESTRLYRLLGALNDTNREALTQLEHPEKDASNIVDLALTACSSLAPEVEILQVWFKTEKANELSLYREMDASTGKSTGRDLTIDLREGKLPDGRGNVLVSAMKAPATIHANCEDRQQGLPGCAGCKCFTVSTISVRAEPQGALVLVNHSKPHVRASVEPVARFIAQQLSMYDTLRQQLRALEEARKLQDDLLLDFQHQIRSPVNMAYAYADLLRQSRSGSVPDELGVVLEATRRASSVASNLQLFVQLARPDPPDAQVREVRPAAIFEKLHSATRNLYSYKALNKKLEFDVDDSWGSKMGRVLIDEIRLDLVFDNLLDNAVKYSFSESKVTVTGGVVHDRSEVFFSFQNKGLPISPEDALRLGTRGQRGDLARASHPEGTGIGLWLAQQVLKSMQGRLEILATNGEGITEMRVYLRRVIS